MSSGTIIQFKPPNITDSLVEDFEKKRRYPKKPVNFFGITESNPVKFIEISEIEIDHPPEKAIPQPRSEEKPEENLPANKVIQKPQSTEAAEEKTSQILDKKLSEIAENLLLDQTLDEKLSNITEKLLSDIVEENLPNIEIEKPQILYVAEIEETVTTSNQSEKAISTPSHSAEKPASNFDVENIENSDELTKYQISPSVLVIEDDRVISSFLQHLLKRRGFLTHHAPDGLKAVEMFDEIPPPNLIIVDLMLPFLDGFELIKKVRGKDQWANVPIIVVTSKTQEQDLTRAFETGANDYLVKPFRSQELIARVKRFVPQK